MVENIRSLQFGYSDNIKGYDLIFFFIKCILKLLTMTVQALIFHYLERSWRKPTEKVNRKRKKKVHLK
jgi:hypothetical protein